MRLLWGRDLVREFVVVASSFRPALPKKPEKKKKKRESKAGHSEVVFARRPMNLFPASRPTLEVSGYTAVGQEHL